MFYFMTGDSMAHPQGGVFSDKYNRGLWSLGKIGSQGVIVNLNFVFFLSNNLKNFWSVSST